MKKTNGVVASFFLASVLTLAVSCSSKKEVVAETEPAVAPAQTEAKTETVQTTTTNTTDNNLGASSSGRGR